jgi:hypothetical protein
MIRSLILVQRFLVREVARKIKILGEIQENCDFAEHRSSWQDLKWFPCYLDGYLSTSHLSNGTPNQCGNLLKSAKSQVEIWLPGYRAKWTKMEKLSGKAFLISSASRLVQSQKKNNSYSYSHQATCNYRSSEDLSGTQPDDVPTVASSGFTEDGVSHLAGLSEEQAVPAVFLAVTWPANSESTRPAATSTSQQSGTSIACTGTIEPTL